MAAPEPYRRFRPAWEYTPHPTIPKHTPVLSRNGRYRGHTLGGGQPCPAKGCIATFGTLWQLAVRWETGDTTIICPAGWEILDTPFAHVRIVAGGEITARYVNPREPRVEQHPLLKAHRHLDWTAAGWDLGAPIESHRRPPREEPTSLF